MKKEMFFEYLTKNIKQAGQTTKYTNLVDHKNGKSYRLYIFTPSKISQIFKIKVQIHHVKQYSFFYCTDICFCVLNQLTHSTWLSKKKFCEKILEAKVVI